MLGAEAVLSSDAVVRPDSTARADVSIDTTMIDEHRESDGFTAERVSHLCFSLNPVDLPTQSTMWLAGLEAHAI
jgi:hypothetical protein